MFLLTLIFITSDVIEAIHSNDNVKIASGHNGVAEQNKNIVNIDKK
jgi:hypothetical protein